MVQRVNRVCSKNNNQRDTINYKSVLPLLLFLVMPFANAAAQEHSWWDWSLTLVADPSRTGNISIKKSFLDFMIGVRYRGSFNERGGYSVRGNGSWGGTEGTCSASAHASYRLNNGKWVFGYRYIVTDLNVLSPNLSLQLYSPIIGYTFKF